MLKKTLTGVDSFHEGPRKYPRVSVDAAASFKLSNESILEVKVYNVSVDGIQMRCDRQTASVIHPDGRFIKDGNGPTGIVTFKLPLESGEEIIIAECQAYYLTVVQGTDEIAFGFGFKKIIIGQASLIEQFITEAIRPS
jgi:hypothetical protein